MATTIIKRISIHPAENTLPPLPHPAQGEAYDAATLQNAGWITIGSVQNGDNINISSDTVKPTYFDEGTEINPPGAQTRQGYIQRKSGVDTLEFGTYDVGEEAFALDSNVAETSPGSGTYEHQGTQTYRSMLIETETGLFIDRYPRAKLGITGESIGYGPGDDAAGAFTFTANIRDSETTGVKSGRHRSYLAPAGS